jgi:hypothetical protein
MLTITKLIGESTTIKDRFKVEPAEACDATLPGELFSFIIIINYLLQLGFRPVAVVLTLVYTIQVDI